MHSSCRGARKYGGSGLFVKTILDVVVLVWPPPSSDISENHVIFQKTMCHAPHLCPPQLYSTEY
eukprot:9479522-Pyramimonas_sp.AAC.1